MSIVENTERVGRFTSSVVHKLMKLGTRKMTPEEIEAHKEANPKSRKTTTAGGFTDAGHTYMQEKINERLLGRSFDLDGYSRSAAWGSFLEMIVNDKLDLKWSIKSDKTVIRNSYHSGSPDLEQKGIAIGDIKAFEPKKFTAFARMLRQQDIDVFRSDYPEEYWQLVSNALVFDVTRVASFVYMPYFKDLDEIRDLAYNYDGADQWQYRFIYEVDKYKLPFVPDDSLFNDLESFEFDLPEEDLQHCEDRLREAAIHCGFIDDEGNELTLTL